MLYIPCPCGCVSTLGTHTLDGPSVCASKCELYVCTDEHPLMVMESVFCVLSVVSLWTYVFSFFLSHLPSKLMFLSNMSFSKLKTQAAMSVFQQKLSKFRLLGFVVKKCRTFDGPSVVGAQNVLVDLFPTSGWRYLPNFEMICFTFYDGDQFIVY